MSAEPVRIAAYYSTPQERDTVLTAMSHVSQGDVQEYSGLVEGSVSRDDLQELVRQQIAIDVVDWEALGSRPDHAPEGRRLTDTASQLLAATPADNPLHKVLHSFAEHTLTEGAEAGTARTAPHARTVDCHIRLTDRMTATRRATLSELGVRLISRTPDSFLAQVPEDRLEAVQALPFVEWARPADVGDFITADFLQELDRSRRTGRRRVQEIDVTAHTRKDIGPVEEALEHTPGVEVVSSAGSTVRIKAQILDPALAQIASLPEVASLAPVREARLLLDVARGTLGVDHVQAPSGALTGQGEIVGVLDSGIDTGHPDLVSAVAFAASLISNSADDHFGHGTHVAGIIAGSGAASGGQIRGVAPDARLAVLKITDGARLQLPPELGDLLQTLYDAGARIVNMSLAVAPDPTGSTYDAYARSVDEFVCQNPDLLVVIAAGNNGVAPDGVCEFGTVGSPGTAKNALTVGACLTGRVMAPETWGHLRPSVFTKPPVSGQPVTGDPNVPAANSGRGPANPYGLVKPDVLAPGTYILSARASAIDHRLPWLDCPTHDNRYVYIGGSSMAAPFASGSAALVRQYLRTEAGMASPSAAMIKACLVAASVRLPSIRPAGSNSDFGYPDYDQGFGRIDLTTLLKHPNAPPARVVELADVANRGDDALERGTPIDSSRRPIRKYSFSVSESRSEPIQLVVAWTDAPGAGVSNHIGLEVILPGGQRVSGNTLFTNAANPLFNHPDAYGISWDRLNCVEKLIIDTPPPGDYLVRVVALDTPFPPQGYALVACGEIQKWTVIPA